MTSEVVKNLPRPILIKNSIEVIQRQMKGKVRLDFTHSKLHGRDEEIKALKLALRNVEQSRKPETVLLQGLSGTGKSVLARTLSQVDDDGGSECFLAGKFDELQSSRPFSGISEAFSRISSLLSRRDDIDAIRSDVMNDLTGGFVHLTKIIPNLARLWANAKIDSREDKMSISWGFERTKAALQDFIRVLSQKHAITTTLFLDDLQWADASSLDLISYLLTDDKTEGLLFVGAYRDNEVDAGHPLAVRIRDVKNSSPFAVQEIKVASLDVNSINCLIAEVTKTSTSSRTMELSIVVHKKTLGNAFFAIQFLKMLQDEGMLCWSNKTCSWTWDIDKIIGDTSLSDSAAGLVTHKLGTLSQWATELLSVAACFGSYFQFEIVAAVIERDPKFEHTDRIKDNLLEALDLVVAEGLVTRREGSSKCLFSHDKVQQGAYSLIADEIEQCKLHIHIGYMLKDMYSKTESREAWMFLVFTDQLNRGSSLIVAEDERKALAQQNLEAASLVMTHSAFFPASVYLKAGLALVGGIEGWAEHYQLVLGLYSTLAEVSFCIGDIETSEFCCNTVFQNARLSEDKYRACVVRIDAWGSQDRQADAIEFALDLVRETGESFPQRPNHLHLIFAVAKAKRLAKGRKDDDILSMPSITDNTKILAMNVLAMLIAICYNQNRELEMVLCLLKMVHLTLRYGLSAHSAFVVAGYGLIAAKLSNFEEASRFCKLSSNLSERYPHKGQESQAIIMRCNFLGHLRGPLQQQLDPLLRGHQYGMECGDIHHASLCAGGYCVIYLFSGLPLGPLVEDAKAFAGQFERYQQATALPMFKIAWQGALNLMGRDVNRVKLVGTAMDQEVYLGSQNAKTSVFGSIIVLEVLIQTAYLFEDAAVGKETCLRLFAIGTKIEGTACRMPSVFMFCALTAMSILSTERKRKFRRIAKMYTKELAKWVEKKALNVQHKLLLVQAQREALNKNKKKKRHDETRVISLFNDAVSASRKAGFTHDAALANELAGKYCLSLNDRERARFYMMDALELYGVWEAQAKVDQMLETYQFLGLQDVKSSFSSSFRGQSRFSTESSTKHSKFDPFQMGG